MQEKRRGMRCGKVWSHEQAESALMMCPLCSFPRVGRKEQLFVPAIPACLPELHSHIIFTEHSPSGGPQAASATLFT